MSGRDAALRVAVMTALELFVSEGLAAARGQAEPGFAEAFNDNGTATVKVLLPDDTPLGTITIKAGQPTVTPDSEVIARLADLYPDKAWHDYIEPHALEDRRVIALIKGAYPEMVERRMRGAWVTNIIKAADADGRYTDKATGDVHQVATVTPAKSAGEFTYRPGDKKRLVRLVMDWWARGRLPDSVGLPALTGPAPEPGDPAPGRVFPMPFVPDDPEPADVAGVSPWDAPAPPWDTDDPYMGVA